MKKILGGLLLLGTVSVFAKTTSSDCKLAVNNLIESAREAGMIASGGLSEDAKARLKPGLEEEIQMHKLSVELECGLTL